MNINQATGVEVEIEPEEQIRVNRDIIGKVIALRGDKQLGMVIEECSELIQAIGKLQRLAIGDVYLDAVKVRENVLEEMADVYVVLETARVLLGFSTGEISEVIKHKQQRLARMIDSGMITSK